MTRTFHSLLNPESVIHVWCPCLVPLGMVVSFLHHLTAVECNTIAEIMDTIAPMYVVYYCKGLLWAFFPEMIVI